MILWDKRAGQYRGKNGRFVSRATVLNLVDKATGAGKARLRNIARKLINRRISVDAWQRATIKELKNSYIQLGLFGGGGKENLSPELRGFMNFTLGDIPLRLHRLAKDLKAGKISEAQLINRVNLYGEQAKQNFYWADKQAHLKAGYKMAVRTLNPLAQHCAECVTHQTKGWVPISEVMPIGHRCSCRARCRCYIRYRRY